MLDFIVTYFATYDITTEVVVLILAFALLVIIILSRPERNHMMRLLIVGLSLSMVTIISHIIMLGQTLTMRKTHSYFGFNLWYEIVAVNYVAVIIIVYLYITQLALKRRRETRIVVTNAVVLGVVSHAILLYPLLTDKLLIYENGIYTLTDASNNNVFCSFICAVMCMGTVIANRKCISKVVMHGTFFFIPFDALGVLAQLYFRTAYFLCATYVLPFVIFYALFHAYRFDEVTGSQYYEAETNMLGKLVQKKKHFLFLSVYYPRLENLDFNDIKEPLLTISNELCKQVESVHIGLRIYRISNFNYHIICPIYSKNDFSKMKDTLLGILDQDYVNGEKQYKTSRHTIVAHDFPDIENGATYLSFIKNLQREFSSPEISQIIEAHDSDCKEYVKAVEIEKNLLSIRTKNDLDDERVIVYLQPIQSIKAGCFKTGEALMRMQINGKMVFPDQFIPVAERIECIHAITRTMLYKTSKKTVEFSKSPDFEAITVNVSTFELNDPKAGMEFLEIIKKAEANPSHIRLEITESTSITDYSTIISNMNYLIENGVKFYLDDFGTGYSNIERIVKFPFMTIKFDKSLLYRALEDKKSEELFLLLISHFKSMGFRSVIEGVETEDQVEYVTKAGFDYIQGYYYSKPKPIDEVRF